MAIIIPSSHYYETTNNKLCNNQINGVSYTEHNYSLVTEIAENVGTLSFSNSSTTEKYYGDWLYIDDGTRQRYEVITDNRYYQNTKDFPNLNKFDEAETNVAGYLNSSSIGYIDFNIPQIKKSFYKIKIPFSNLNDEQLELFVKFLSSHIVHIYLLSSPHIMIVAPTKITINIETEHYENGNWQVLNSIEKYSVSFTESLYDVVVGRKTTKDKTAAFNVGENTNYSLLSTNFLSNGSKIDKKQLGQYISEEIINNYRYGKETAKMTCIIGDYFDENNNKIISIDGEKMVFDIYDEVIPLTYTNLSDKPMSITNDGKAKVFIVLESRVFYDGAVWQELTLQETGKSIDISKTTYTTIANKAGGLTYKITSNEIVTEENSAGGITYIIGE